MKTLKNLLQDAVHTQNLTDSERASMRANLETHMRQHTGSSAIPSPWVTFFSLPRTTAFALALLCIVGGGSTLAAQTALPGDILYPVKIHVNENLQVALADTPTEKLAVQTQLADTRITEAQTLALRGDLTPSTTQDLEDNFSLHVSQALAISETIPSPAISTPVVPPTTKDTDTAPATTGTAPAVQTFSAAKMAVSTSSVPAGSKKLPAPATIQASESTLTATLKASFSTKASILERLKNRTAATSTATTTPQKVPTKKPYIPATSTTKATSTTHGSTTISSTTPSHPAATSTPSSNESVPTHILTPSAPSTPTTPAIPHLPSVTNLIKSL